MVSYPDATTAGVPAGVTLTASGGMTITKAGTVIDGLDIHGTVNIEADNVTIKNSKITTAGGYGVQVGDGVTGAVVQNNDINGSSGGGVGINIAGNGTFTGNNIHNVSDGMSIGGTTSTAITDNYIHDMTGPSNSHFDGIQILGGSSNIKIDHNTILNENGQTSAVMIGNDFGPTTNVTVNNNLMTGGGYTIYDSQGSGPAVTNTIITNNHMGEGYYGYTDFNNTSPVYTGNVMDGDAMAATLQSTGSPSGTGGGSTPTPPLDGGGTTPTPPPSDGGTTPGSGTGSGSTPSDPSSGVTTEKFWWGTAVNGTSGNDTLVDVAGKDVMTGAGGGDHFVFNTVANMGSTSWNRDIISDFTPGTDKIDLSALDASSKVSGNQAFSFLAGDNQVFSHTPGQIAWRTDTAHNQTIIQGDTNGDGTHDFEIQLTGIHPLHSSDFIF